MVFLVLAGAYLLGSLPFGYIQSRLYGTGDIRKHGSGNIGATNVLRVHGWRAALPVFVLDLFKGLAAVLLARAVSDTPSIYLGAGLLAMIGHSFPAFLGFRGGKAAATGIGVLIALSGWVALASVALSALVIYLSRYVSLGSICGALAVPLLFIIFGYDQPYIFFGLGMALLVTLRHHANIARLVGGREPRLGRKAKQSEAREEGGGGD